MNIRQPIVIVLIAAAIFLVGASSNNSIKYPEAKRVKQVDYYHGTNISDPYRWMEDVDNSEVQTWINAQEGLLEEYLAVNPLRDVIKNRIEKLGKTGKSYGTPTKRGDYYFYGIGDGHSKYSRQYKEHAITKNREMIYDPNPDFASRDLAPTGYSISPNGKYMAIKTSRSQANYGDVRIMNINDGSFLGETLSGIANMALAWSKDESGFYYIDYGNTAELTDNKKQPKVEIRYHRLGTSHEEDALIHANPNNPNVLYRLNISQDYQFLVISLFTGTRSKNKVYLKDLRDQGSKVVPFLNQGDHAYTYLGSEKDRFWFYTNHSAPNGRIVAIDLAQSQPSYWVEIVPESKETIAGGSTAGGNAMAMAGQRLVLLYRDGPLSIIKVFSKEGDFERKLELETGWLGSGLVGTWQDNEIWFSLTTFTAPTEVYRYDLNTGKGGAYFKLDLPIDKSDYVAKHIFYTSKDGTRVPLFIAHRKDLKRDGNNPGFMYGYGFGGWVATPWYQPHMLTWLEMGGVYAMPGIRGGGEYGNQWMEAGIRLNRQNAIDDFIAAAEWLIDNGYSSPKQMVANGWSASGSLAAAAVMQRPDLFGAGLIGIPSLDLLRYQHYTPFKGWTSGFGSSEVAEEFTVLKSYSPYHNIKKGECYPPMLVTVGEKDETTPPQHGYKFVAAMQYNQQCENPVMLKIVRGAGHSFGISSEQSRQTYTDELTYLAKVLKLDEDEIKKKLQ